MCTVEFEQHPSTARPLTLPDIFLLKDHVHTEVKFYCLWQVHLAENLPQATHTQNRAKLHKYGVKHALRILDGHFR